MGITTVLVRASTAVKGRREHRSSDLIAYSWLTVSEVWSIISVVRLGIVQADMERENYLRGLRLAQQ